MLNVYVTAIALATFALGVMVGRFSGASASSFIFHLALASAYGMFAYALFRRR